MKLTANQLIRQHIEQAQAYLSPREIVPALRRWRASARTMKASTLKNKLGWWVHGLRMAKTSRTMDVTHYRGRVRHPIYTELLSAPAGRGEGRGE